MPGACAITLAAACSGSPAPPEPKASATLTVTSSAFTDGAPIPTDYTCAGSGHRPPLHWSTPQTTPAAYAVVVADPDAPSGTYYHWLVVNLPPSSTDATDPLPPGAKQLNNSSGNPPWTPPCPPSGTHHYHFTVYALAAPIDATAMDDAFTAINKATTATGTLTGTVAHT